MCVCCQTAYCENVFVRVCPCVCVCVYAWSTYCVRMCIHAYVRAVNELLSLSLQTGVYPIHVAVNTGSPDKTLFLLNRNAKVNQMELQDGRTALHLACIRRDFPMVQILIEKGADAGVLDRVSTYVYTCLNMLLGYRSLPSKHPSPCKCPPPVLMILYVLHVHEYTLCIQWLVRVSTHPVFWPVNFMCP